MGFGTISGIASVAQPSRHQTSIRILADSEDIPRIRREITEPISLLTPPVVIELVPAADGTEIPPSGAWVVITRRLIDHRQDRFKRLLEIWKSDRTSFLILIDNVRIPMSVAEERRVSKSRQTHELLREVYEKALPSALRPALIPAVRPLAGRSEELQEIKDSLLDSGLKFVAVVGLGGQGKTTLVRHAVSIFSIPASWVDVSDEPELPALVTRIQRALGVAVDGEPQSLVSAAIDHDEVLVVDNLESLMPAGTLPRAHERLFLLLGASTSLKIVFTSRVEPRVLLRDSASSARVIGLNGLDREGVSELLRSLGLQMPAESVMAIWRWSGGNPLAVKLLVGFIPDPDSTDPADIQRALEEAVPDISALVESHLRFISERELMVVRQLAWHGGTQGLRQIALGIAETESVAPLVLKLSRRNLVEYISEAEVTLHPLVRQAVVASMMEKLFAEVLDPASGLEIMSSVLLLDPRASLAERKRHLQRLEDIVARLRARGLRGQGRWAGRFESLLEIGRTADIAPIFLPANTLSFARASGFSLAGANLSGLYLANADLRGLDLRDTDFTDVEFHSCEFSDDFGPITAVHGIHDGTRRLWIGGTFEGHLRLWDNDGTPRGSIAVGTTWVSAIAGETPESVFVGTVDGSLYTTDILRGSATLLARWGSAQIRSIALAEGRIYVACSDGNLYTYDLTTQEQTKLWAAPYRLKFVCLSSTGDLAVGGDDPRVVILSAGTQQVCAPSGRAGWTRCGAFSADGTLVVGGDDGVLRSWVRARDGSWEEVQSAVHGARIWSLAIDDGAGQVLTGANDGAIHVWSLSDFRKVGTMHGHSSWVRSIFLDPSSGRALSGGEDQRVVLWEVNSFEPRFIRLGYSRRLFSVDFMTGNGLVCSTGDHRIVTFAGSDLDRMDSWNGHSDQVFTLHCRGGFVASGSDDGEVRIWNTEGQILTVLPRLHAGWVGSVRLTDDAALLFSGGDDRRLAIIDVVAGAVANERETHDGRISGIAVLSRDIIVAVSEDGTVRRLAVPNLFELNSWQASKGPLYCVASFAHRIIVGGSAGILLELPHDLSSVAELADFGVPIWSADFNPVTGTLAVGLDDGRVVVLAHDGSVRTFTEHKRQVWSVRWSPDGRLLASASQDATVKLYQFGDDIVRSASPPTLYAGMLLRGASGLVPGERKVLDRLGAKW
ncbi:PQQ-binding-like beta-propeller repeat protein [Micromonospora sp. NPDC049662]|uniref:NB-ARC domain-containing protein n=1 Tax=Micromonospora sp. NPDC049662 TaxID=3155397 RepID=UPI00341753F3